MFQRSVENKTDIASHLKYPLLPVSGEEDVETHQLVCDQPQHGPKHRGVKQCEHLELQSEENRIITLDIMSSLMEHLNMVKEKVSRSFTSTSGLSVSSSVISHHLLRAVIKEVRW